MPAPRIPSHWPLSHLAAAALDIWINRPALYYFRWASDCIDHGIFTDDLCDLYLATAPASPVATEYGIVEDIRVRIKAGDAARTGGLVLPQGTAAAITAATGLLALRKHNIQPLEDIVGSLASLARNYPDAGLRDFRWCYFFDAQKFETAAVAYLARHYRSVSACLRGDADPGL